MRLSHFVTACVIVWCVACSPDDSGSEIQGAGGEQQDEKLPSEKKKPAFAEDADWGACWFVLPDGSMHCNYSLREVCPVGDHFLEFEPKGSCEAAK